MSARKKGGEGEKKEKHDRKFEKEKKTKLGNDKIS